MTISCLRASLAAVSSLLFVLPVAGGAQTLPLSFEPPEIQVGPVCIARKSDEALTAQWEAWDGAALPQQDVGLISRDIRRLAEIDPVAWDPTIQRVITLLPGVSRSFSPEHGILARIDQMIAMGQLQQLKSEGLVQQLLDRGDENSPKMLNALANFLSEGIGIDRDSTRGAEFLMAAAYGGNADALLTLSRLAVSGAAPEGWDINPQLAVTMAFGSLVGQIDPLICDRIGRIAREFSSGEVVETDHDLAVRWYRFAADLGDPVAAWRVAEYELQSELVTKDNDVLITYLTKAANGNLPYAQVALGRVYEAGALIPVDIARARSLYEAATDSGDRAGLIRLSGFLEAQLEGDPTVEAAFLDTLDRIAHLENPPAWIFAKLASHVLQEKGRWAGQDEARALLEKGAALDDPIAIMMLAQINFGTARTDVAFYAAVDTLIHALTTLGEAAPAADLRGAFLCKAPDAPLLEQAAYWAEAEAAIGSSSTEFTVSALEQLVKTPDPLAMAALQTQALYGRATPLANLLAVLESSDAPKSALAFWDDYANRYANVATARAALSLERATNTDERDVALNAFRAAIATGETGAALKLAKALLADGTDAARAEALALLGLLAKDGNGQAMALLPSADPVAYRTNLDVFKAFSSEIDARGDFMALTLAIPFLTDATVRDAYLGRAITAMQCSFPEALAFANMMALTGNPVEVRRWLAIADHLVGQNAWQIVELGDSHRTLLGRDGEATAQAYYEQAYDRGSRTAVLRLLRVHGDPATETYDKNRVVELYTELVARSDPSQIIVVLDDLSHKDTALRMAVEARLDLDRLYADAAAAGNTVAMREHARRLQISALTVEDLQESTGWLVRASEGGDAPAMVMLAQAYSMGVGVPASVENAQDWLIRAADAGDAAALDLVKLFSVGKGTN